MCRKNYKNKQPNETNSTIDTQEIHNHLLQKQNKQLAKQPNTNTYVHTYYIQTNNNGH